NITVNSNTEATDITTNTPMLNIPQELTAWKVSETATKSKLEADNAKQCYLEIACKIRQSGAYLLGSASEYETIYVPFGDTWEQGKRHIYTLIFGGGYTDQGEAVLNPIQFDAETTGWV
ncbi:fimbrillin family protein, partial [Odoribacter splanchnicus]